MFSTVNESFVSTTSLPIQSEPPDVFEDESPSSRYSVTVNTVSTKTIQRSRSFDYKVNGKSPPPPRHAIFRRGRQIITLTETSEPAKQFSGNETEIIAQ